MMSDKAILLGISDDEKRDETVLALIQILGHTSGEREARKFIEWMLNRKLEGGSIIAKTGDRLIKGIGEYLIAQVEANRFSAIHIPTGNRYRDPVHIENGADGFTDEQLKEIAGTYTKIIKAE
jgi:hypothetical protein